MTFDLRDAQLYNGCNEPCDTPDGPCVCGAWHNWDETIARLPPRMKSAALRDRQEAEKISSARDEMDWDPRWRPSK